MLAAPLPADEPERLAALHACHVLYGPPDPRLDAFAKLAARLLGTPIAALSLVDETKQVFKAAVGLDGIRETSREVSFCAHAILRPGEALVVEDATLDPRFVDNPLVLGDPGIRFYVGIPLLDPDGYALGALCAVDTRPRQVGTDELTSLIELARGASATLELHRRLEELRRAAERDPLTGLANRAAFERCLAEVIATGEPAAVLYVDLDRFKAVNDLYGHAGGDSLLRETGRRLTASIRSTDVAARLGGDEFALVLRGPGTTSEMLDRIADRAITKLAVPFQVEGYSVPIKASIGGACFPANASDADMLSRCADAALYRAKAAGRGCYRRFNAAIDQELTAQLALEGDLKRAAATGTFHLHWQPILDLSGGRVITREALLRWDRPGHGPVPPSTFIPLAEERGLISIIDAWAIRQACREAAQWPAMGEGPAPKAAVNLSASWLRSGQIVGLVADALSASSLDPARLELEITETALITDAEMARATMLKLKQLGVGLALDDFGSGYSSLAYLATFPFEKVKLDRGFIQDIDQNGRARAVLQAVLQLGRALQLTVCIEGVETQAQLDVLRAEGCDQIQGFLLGRPCQMPTPFQHTHPPAYVTQ